MSSVTTADPSIDEKRDLPIVRFAPHSNVIGYFLGWALRPKNAAVLVQTYPCPDPLAWFAIHLHGEEGYRLSCSPIDGGYPEPTPIYLTSKAEGHGAFLAALPLVSTLIPAAIALHFGVPDTSIYTLVIDGERVEAVQVRCQVGGRYCRLMLCLPETVLWRELVDWVTLIHREAVISYSSGVDSRAHNTIERALSQYRIR